LSKAEDNQYVDFTIWGETAVPFDLYYDAEHISKLRRAVPPHGYLITGFLRYADGSYYHPYNSFGVISKQGTVEGVYDKSHLVPFGEYIPLRKYLPAWVRPLTNTVAEFGRGNQYETIKIAEYPEFAPLICYEIIFSSQVIRKTDKPKWIIVLTNDGWYGNSSGPYQHLVAAQMRAVEEGVSVVRSANSGISAVINPYGEVVEQIPLNMKGVIDVAVKLDEAHNTLFGKLGNFIPLSLAVLLLLFAIYFEKIVACFRRRHTWRFHFKIVTNCNIFLRAFFAIL
ncbi:MAG: apolipoprotein N-acyltransferase, partial [Alphaproteobacteria bacterium]|nr:apolipoprotein N-acyltransferase [Alphaproteobacteria bacterium]